MTNLLKIGYIFSEQIDGIVTKARTY